MSWLEELLKPVYQIKNSTIHLASDEDLGCCEHEIEGGSLDDLQKLRGQGPTFPFLAANVAQMGGATRRSKHHWHDQESEWQVSVLSRPCPRNLSSEIIPASDYGDR